MIVVAPCSRVAAISDSEEKLGELSCCPTTSVPRCPKLAPGPLGPSALSPFGPATTLVWDEARSRSSLTHQPAHRDGCCTPTELAAFQRWIESGGGVMTTAGYPSDEMSEVANVNRLSNALGVGYSTDAGARAFLQG